MRYRNLLRFSLVLVFYLSLSLSILVLMELEQTFRNKDSIPPPKFLSLPVPSVFCFIIYLVLFPIKTLNLSFVFR